MLKESRIKMKTIKPATLGQASRIPGVTPADIRSLQYIYEKKKTIISVSRETNNTLTGKGMNKNLNPFLTKAKARYELKELERLGLTPDMNQREQILSYICLLLKWNKIAGLISKADEENFFMRHFCDSLQPLAFWVSKKCNGT